MRRVFWWLFAILGVVVITASLAPLIETNVWWIRVLDFPRLQYLVMLTVLALLVLVTGSLRSGSTWALMAAFGAAFAYNIYKLHPYWPGAADMAVALESCPDDARVSILVVNVQKGNRQAASLIEIVTRADPDILLAMETDEWWDRQLQPLSDQFAEKVQHVGDGYFGMHLFSKLPLSTPEVLFLAEQDVPSIFADATLRNGSVFQVIGLHPRPPHPVQASTGRDAQILLAALESRQSKASTVLAGDLNAVPWERVVRRAMRIGGLLDPRVGRAFLATYDAQQPLMRWPLDHVLYENGLALLEMERLEKFGSDHFPFLVSLCHAPDVRDRQSAPALQPDDLEEAERSIEAARDGAPD